MKALRLAIAVLVLFAAMAPANAQLQTNCFGGPAIQSGVAAGRILALAVVLKRNGIDPRSLVVPARVCERNGVLSYVLVVLQKNGNGQQVRRELVLPAV